MNGKLLSVGYGIMVDIESNKKAVSATTLNTAFNVPPKRSNNTKIVQYTNSNDKHFM